MNVLLFHNDKQRGARRSDKQLALFQDTLHNCHLHDLGFSKGMITWVNNRNDEFFIKEKLDQAIASESWYDTLGDGDI